MITKVCSCFAQGNDLGVSSGVVFAHVPVPSASKNPVIADYDCPDWDFASLQRALSSTQCILHPEFVAWQGVGSLHELPALIVKERHLVQLKGPFYCYLL